MSDKLDILIDELNLYPNGYAKKRIQSLIAEEQRALLEYLLDAQDQEVDADGRATTKPYYQLADGSARDFVEDELNKLKQLEEPQA